MNQMQRRNQHEGGSCNDVRTIFLSLSTISLTSGKRIPDVENFAFESYWGNVGSKAIIYDWYMFYNSSRKFPTLRTGNIEISESDVRLLELKYGSCTRNLYFCYGVSRDVRVLNYKNLLLKWSNDFTSLKPNNFFYFSEVLNNVLYWRTCMYFMLTRNLR